MKTEAHMSVVGATCAPADDSRASRRAAGEASICVAGRAAVRCASVQETPRNDDGYTTHAL
jgi:hypothetical protein